jgi:O-antigen/teichoic acid export membrane protein
MQTAKAESRLRAKTLYSVIGLKLGAEGLGRVAQFGTLALAARSLSLADFGQYGLALVVGFLLAQLSDGGLHLLVTRQLSRIPHSDIAAQALATKLWLSVGLAGLVGAASLLGLLAGTFALLVLACLVYSLAEFSFAVFRARAQLPYEAALVIGHRLGLLAGASLTFLSGAGLGGLALAHIGAAGAVAGVASGLAGVRPGRSFDLGLLKTSAPIGLAIFLSLLAFKIDLPLLQWLDGRAAEVGLYNAAYRLFEPLLLFPAAILAGVFPGLARRALSEVESDFGSQAAKLLLVLLGSGVLAGGLLGLNAAWLVGWLYGQNYAPAAPTLSLLGLAVPFLFINSGLTYLLLALDRERYNLYFFAVALLVNMGANLLLIPLWSRNGAAVATLLTEVSLTSLTGLALLRTLKKLPPALPAPRPTLLKKPVVNPQKVGFGALLVLSSACLLSLPNNR